MHDFNAVESYFNSTTNPKVDILNSESPDVTAPGVEILAAYSPLNSSSDNPLDTRSVNYSIITGTSMSCPHVSGAAAYVKSFHPDWSPSAIKSALMTTAWRMDSKKDSLAEFSYGAGHIDPARAAHPGLVYETFLEDYVKLLCSLGYDTTKLRRILGGNISCPNGTQTTPKDLNYPALTSRIVTKDGKSVNFSEKFKRTVTNVGLRNSTYKVTTSTSPHILTFGAVHEKKSFEVVKWEDQWEDSFSRVGMV